MKTGIWILAFMMGAMVGRAGPRASAQDSAADPSVRVWELPRASGAQAPDVDGRKGWKLLDPDAPKAGPFAGGLAVENPHLVAILPAGGREILLFSKGKGKAAHVRQDLVLLGAQGRPAGDLGAPKLVEYAQAHAVVSLAAGEAEAKLRMVLGGPFVEIAPGKNAGAMLVRSRSRFSFIPDFFGNDVLYDATQTRAAKLLLPTENFLVNLIEGHAALTMIVWPLGGGAEASVLAEGSGAGRRFTATQVSFDRKSLFVAVLAREGIWFDKDLTAAQMDKTFVVEGWQPPFPAKWMTILVRRPAVGATAGIASQTVAAKELDPEGDTPYDDVFEHPRVPSWVSGGRWRLHLQTTLTHRMTGEEVKVPDFLLAINYPRDRVKNTQVQELTLVDLMRGTLGVGPCKFVLDVEGLNKTRSTGAAGTGKPTAAATCDERGGLVFYYLGERTQSPRRDEPLLVGDSALESVEKIKDFLDAADARIQEYLTWSDGIVKLCLEAKARAGSPGVQELAERVVPIAREMRGLWDKMAAQKKPCAFPGEWRAALDHCKDLIRRGGPNLGDRIRQFDPQMRGAGEEVDGGMQACRMIAKRIRQAAALAGTSDPEALKLAATIRRRCRDVLKNKHEKEGDDVRLGAESGEE